MRLTETKIDRRRRRGMASVQGETFRCRFETDWNTEHRGAFPRYCEFLTRPMWQLRFGMAAPWDWILDLDARELPHGVVVSSQGYRELKIGRIPFLRTRRFFWNSPEMLYEVNETRHLKDVHYTICCKDARDMIVDGLLERIIYRRDGVDVCWQFAPAPVFGRHHNGWGWVLEFDSPTVETLIQWGQAGAAFPTFRSISPEVRQIRVSGPRGDRGFDAAQKHQCVEPNERLILPDADNLFTGDPGAPGSALSELAVRKCTANAVELGAARIFSLERLAETPSFPMFKPSLVRTLRSLKERMVFGVVPEDDPDQLYQWGTGTWPRCFSVLSLDRFGFHEEAIEYLEFMLDASEQFIPHDGEPHLWDNFHITGPKLNDRLYDINGHAIKLFEAGKFYLRHRGDSWGRRLREKHYDILRGWCRWIEQHMESDGAVVDETESNIWAYGFGTFSQAPAAAGVKLFTHLAADAGKTEDVTHFSAIVERLMHGLNTRLWGDAANPYWELPAGLGNCYLTYVPMRPDTRNWNDKPVKHIGLSCYSLAAPYFLADPDIALLAPDDPRVAQTLDLALAHGGDAFDRRMTAWHVHPKVEAHMGYGPGQMLQSLLFTGRGETFRDVLAGLFDVSTRETGDVYLMQEILGRIGNPNRGNKAAVAYFPYLAALLAGFDVALPTSQVCLPDLIVRQ